MNQMTTTAIFITSSIFIIGGVMGFIAGYIACMRDVGNNNKPSV